MVLTVSFVLSPVIGLSCHRRLANGGKSAPGRADLASARLDAGVEASGPHDFIVRDSVGRPRAVWSLTGMKPALHPVTRPDAAASTASRPAFVTIASRPPEGRDGEGYAADLGRKGTEIFLKQGLDR